MFSCPLHPISPYWSVLRRHWPRRPQKITPCWRKRSTTGRTEGLTGPWSRRGPSKGPWWATAARRARGADCRTCSWPLGAGVRGALGPGWTASGTPAASGATPDEVTAENAQNGGIMCCWNDINRAKDSFIDSDVFSPEVVISKIFL